MTSTVTVFGGTGFLGRQIAAAAARAGFEVRAASRRPSSRSVEAVSGPITHVCADVQEESSVAAAVAGAGTVVNAVSLYVEKKNASFESVHVAGAERVARCARAAGARVMVHVSGLGVDLGSRSRFIRARALGEQAVGAAFPGAAVLRPSVLFGHGDSFLSNLEKISRLPVIPLFGSGGARLQPADVQDVAAAAVAVIRANGAHAGLFELGGAEIYSYRKALELVLAHLHRRRVLVPVPLPVWEALTAALALLHSPPLTRDQLVLLAEDNVVTGIGATFRELDIRPAGLAAALPRIWPQAPG